MNTQQDLLAAYEAYMSENEKFEKGNSARKALADVGKAVKARRNEITAEKNARKEAKAAK